MYCGLSPQYSTEKKRLSYRDLTLRSPELGVLDIWKSIGARMIFYLGIQWFSAKLLDLCNVILWEDPTKFVKVPWNFTWWEPRSFLQNIFWDTCSNRKAHIVTNNSCMCVSEHISLKKILAGGLNGNAWLNVTHSGYDLYIRNRPVSMGCIVIKLPDKCTSCFGQSKHVVVGIILGMGSAYERRCCCVTSSLIGWAHTQNDPWEGWTWTWSFSNAFPWMISFDILNEISLKYVCKGPICNIGSGYHLVPSAWTNIDQDSWCHITGP